MKTSRPIRARISPAALLHNYRLAKQLAPQAKAWAADDRNRVISYFRALDEDHAQRVASVTVELEPEAV